MNNDSPSIDKIKRAADMLKAIAHPIRLSIIELIVANKKMSVTEIHEKLNIEQAVASQHLKILKDKNVLQFNRDGKHCIYFLKYVAIENIIKYLHQCQECE